MAVLPGEIWSEILDYLAPEDVVSTQRTSHRLLKLARDPSLWRNKVYEKAPSATSSHAGSWNALSALTGALGGLSIGESQSTSSMENSTATNTLSPSRVSRRAKAILEWDRSDPSEHIDWYSEYIARHAPLSAVWYESSTAQPEIRGIAILNDANKVICTSDDGSLGVWDISPPREGRRTPILINKSRSGLLFEDMYSLGEPSLSSKNKLLGTNVETISVDSKRQRAFCAVGNNLNEVDLERMQVVSQTKFAWPITALPPGGGVDNALTVGTSFSLHIYDPRMPYVKPTDGNARLDCFDESKIAFFQNYHKGPEMTTIIDDQPQAVTMDDHRFLMGGFDGFARVEPGPQSILHQRDHEIIISGRMPSILFYDRRSFPVAQAAIHSGARLSAMTVLDVPPPGAASTNADDSTLIACGEYGGRGSLEMYQLPWQRRESTISTSTEGATDRRSNTHTEPFSFKNRQEASSSKLLSVATQGTRIVFSDSEGMLKWVERDGRGLARRWNINAYQMDGRGASLSGDKVVRKMIALPEVESGRGTRGDGDLLVWTGERIGIVTTKPKPWDDHEELVQAFERGMNLNGEDGGITDQQREKNYATIMRQALEQQANERRWMSRFNTRR